MSQDRVAALRSAFDAAFAEARGEMRDEGVAFLLFRLGSQPFAVKLAEVAALEPLGKVVPLPAAAAELLGLAAIKAQLVPVYALARLVGAPEGERSRWLLVCDRGDPIGLAFTAFDGYAKLPESALARAEGGARFVPAFATIGATRRGVIDTGSVVAAIRSQAKARSPSLTPGDPLRRSDDQ